MKHAKNLEKEKMNTVVKLYIAGKNQCFQNYHSAWTINSNYSLLMHITQGNFNSEIACLIIFTSKGNEHERYTTAVMIDIFTRPFCCLSTVVRWGPATWEIEYLTKFRCVWQNWCPMETQQKSNTKLLSKIRLVLTDEKTLFDRRDEWRL